MKRIIFSGATLVVLAMSACSETTKTDNVTNNPDTAVLKQDTANRLNATPVNDTAMPEKPAPQQ